MFKIIEMSNGIAAGERICNRGSLVSGWVCGLLLLFFLPRPSSLPPPELIQSVGLGGSPAHPAAIAVASVLLIEKRGPRFRKPQ